MSETLTAVAGRLAEARRAGGLSQRDLARFSMLSQSTVHRIESGNREASTIELSLLADACGVLVADLRGCNPIADKVHCAGRTDDSAHQALTDYLTYAFSCSQRLRELGLPDPA